MTEEKTLSREALKMREFSYSPYSHFRVGAALLDKQGNIYTGCNIENSSYSPSNCAERTAFFKAVSEGIREFEAIAIAGGPEGAQELNYCPPCGVCRQVMREFCEDDFKIILVKSEEEYKVFTLGELLPQSFWADF
ncbi:MAG TPA: cytidine deaminase [Candidatus Bariatricus faecipullorum]|nr:cytidine deaminase [Candidatus Bariatricus faecipullorum]